VLSVKRDLIFAPLPSAHVSAVCMCTWASMYSRGYVAARAFLFHNRSWCSSFSALDAAAALVAQRRRKARSGGAGGEGAVSALPPFPARPPDRPSHLAPLSISKRALHPKSAARASAEQRPLPPPQLHLHFRRPQRSAPLNRRSASRPPGKRTRILRVRLVVVGSGDCPNAAASDTQIHARICKRNTH
jgi:hypothetical protein